MATIRGETQPTLSTRRGGTVVPPRTNVIPSLIGAQVVSRGKRATQKGGDRQLKRRSRGRRG